MKRRAIILVVILLLGVGGSAALAWRGSQDTAGQPKPAASAQATDERLVAEGKVVPLQHALLSLPTGGIVSTAHVAEGDRVVAGQPLLELDRARAEANVAQARGNLAEDQAAYDKLLAGATPEEIAIGEAQLRAAQAQLRQTTGGVTPADRAAAEAQLAGAQAHLAELRAGPKRPDLQAAEAQLAQAQASLSAQRDQLSAAKSNAQLMMEQRTNDLTRAQSAYATALQNWQYVQETGKDPLTEILDQKTGKKLHPTLNDPQRQQYYSVYVQAEAALQLAQVALDETELRAPFSGVVATLDLKIGEFVAPGAPILHLADLSTWQIETTDLTELDVTRVRVGSPVTMTFDAIPGIELMGRVSRIRPLGENKQGDITYVVSITLDRQDARLHWNMTAAVSIGVRSVSFSEQRV